MEWNNDPAWVEYIQKFEPVIKAISYKCTSDIGLQEDCQQEARIALLTVFPEKVRTNLNAYCRNVIRNSMLSYLESYRTGDLYSGRTLRRKAGKVHAPPRFSSLDQLVDEHGMQVDEEGRISWIDPASDGLLEFDEGGRDAGRPYAAGESAEDAILDAIEASELRGHLEGWIDQLSDENRRIIRGHLAGLSFGDLGVPRYHVRRAIHQLRIIVGTELTCSVCGVTKNAGAFYAFQLSKCRTCYNARIRERSVARKREARPKEPNEPKEPKEPKERERKPSHGRTGTYRRGCRCELCRKAQAAYNAEWRRRRRAKNAA